MNVKELVMALVDLMAENCGSSQWPVADAQGKDLLSMDPCMNSERILKGEPGKVVQATFIRGGPRAED